MINHQNTTNYTDLDPVVASEWQVKFTTVLNKKIRLRVATAGNGPLVILVHGFPESWYSWRHQIKPLTDAGFQVAIPDVRGYGGSDKPPAIDAYSIKALTSDMAAIARALSPSEQAVIIGHDWGAPIAWNSALLFGNQFHAVGGLSVPYIPPAEMNAIDLFRKIFTDKGLFHYMVYFQEEGVAEAELEEDIEKSIRLFYTALAADAKGSPWQQNKPATAKLFDRIPEPELPRPWLSKQDIQYYASQFSHGGFRSPLNRYRNFERDNDFLKQQNTTVIRQPSLFVHGDKDLVNRMYPEGPIEAMRPYVSARHRAVMLENCGHWTQQEKPVAVNEILLDWLATVF